MSDLSD
jgi:hypothetical protein